MHRGSVWMVAAFVVLVGACDQGALEEVRKGQKDILAKLDKLEKAIAERPTAAPARPTVDPNQVYDIPVGRSPIKGPRTASVTIAEFSDFQ